MKPFRITSLEAHQIGPFGDLKMTFPAKPAGMEGKAEVHILTGENGTGKTTLMETLISGLKTKTAFIRRRRKNKTAAYQINFSKGKPSTFNSSTSFNWSPEAIEIWMDLDKVGEDYSYSIAAFAYSGFRRMGYVQINNVKEIQDHPFMDALDFEYSIKPENILQWVGNNIAKDAIAKSNNDIAISAKYRMAVTQLEKVIERIIEQPISFFFEYNPMGISVEVNHERLDFNLLPDGLKSIISWLADLLMRMDRVKWVDDIPVFERNFILFLDEIEVHMHPRWQRKILPAVQGLFPNAQIFISTHSPFVINSVDGAWIHRLVKPNGDSVALEPVLSEDGKSINQVLEEIFDVTERFGVGVEADLKAFYEVRNKLIKNGSSNGKEEEKLIQIAKKLQGQSTTLDQIVAMEIRQLNRIKQLEITV